LIDAKIINKNIEWIAEPKDTIVVQMGDQVDSVNRDPVLKDWEVLPDVEMLYFTDLLNKMALSKGGRVISLIGNHELMNVIGDFSYVSPLNKNDEKSREKLFKPKGSIGLILAKRPLIIKIRDLIFCHAKLELEHLKLLKKYNKDIFYINHIWNNYLENNKINIEDKEIIDNIIIGSNGILWNRNNNDSIKTNELYNELGISYMFVGHTALDKITLVDNQLWYCDTGLSRAFGTTKYQYIDINNNSINVKTINLLEDN
jgi:hypothetical protein